MTNVGLGTRATSSFYLGGPAFVLLVATASAAAGCHGCKGDSSGSSGEPTKELTTPGKAYGIPMARAAYVTNNVSDTIGVIDRDGDAVDAVPIDIDPSAHEAPHHLTIDPASNALFVALALPPDASKEVENKKDPHASHGRAANNGRLARLELGKLAVTETREVDENPGDVLLTHDRSRVLVTHFDMKRAMDVAHLGGGSPATMFAALMVFDAKTMKKLGARPVCTAPHGMATTKDDKTAFVACYGGDELAVVDLSADGLPTARHPLGSSPGVPGVPTYGPYAATLTPDESRVVVDDLDGQDVRVFDRKEERFVKTIPLAAKAFMPAFVDAKTLIVPTQSPDGVAKVDVDLGKVTGRGLLDRDVCALPHVVRVDRAGRAFMVCEGDHRTPGSVVELDPATLAVKKRWQVGVYPDGIAFGDD